MSTLFQQLTEAPLADKMRPSSLDEVVGQSHLLGEKAPLARMIASGKISSFILWGPPGCGKTALAKVIAEMTKNNFKKLNAVNSGVGDIKSLVAEAKNVTVSLDPMWHLAGVNQVRMDETMDAPVALNGGAFSVSVPGKKIMTYRIHAEIK